MTGFVTETLSIDLVGVVQVEELSLLDLERRVRGPSRPELAIVTAPGTGLTAALAAQL